MNETTEVPSFYLTTIEGEIIGGYEILIGNRNQPMVTYYSTTGQAIASDETQLWSALRTGGWTAQVSRDEFWSAID